MTTKEQKQALAPYMGKMPFWVPAAASFGMMIAVVFPLMYGRSWLALAFAIAGVAAQTFFNHHLLEQTRLAHAELSRIKQGGVEDKAQPPRARMVTPEGDLVPLPEGSPSGPRQAPISVTDK